MSTGLTARRGRQGALVLSLVCFSMAARSADESQVVITASRMEEPVEDSFWSSTVLTREDIQSRQVSSVQDVLADLAGVDIGNAGGLGKATSVFLRGTNSDHTLLLIDGVRVGSATLGTAPFELLPLDQIDRIEVVRGPRSTLYGSDAIGGVIQIFTRRPKEAGVSFGGSVMDGSHDTHEFTADFQARGSRAWVSINGDILTTNGINSCLPGAFTAGAACFQDAPNPGPDGFHNHSGSVTAGVRLTDQISAEATEMITDGWTAFDGDFQNNTEFQERVTSFHIDGAITDAWRVRLSGGHDVDVQKNFLDTTPAGRFDTSRDQASLQVQGQATSALRLISGFDWQRDHIDSDTPYDVTSRSTKGVFSELHGELGPWSALAGARYEDNDQFGDHVTENFGLTRKLSERERVTVTWGTAFHAPTFNDLYFPTFPGFPPASNPNLKPEESKSVEVGIDGMWGAGGRTQTGNTSSAGAPGTLSWSLHVYQTTIDQLIAYDANFTPQNISQARIRGAELQAEWRSQAWKFGGQVTAMDPLNRDDGPDRDNLLPRRAKTSASLEIRRFVTIAPGLSPGSIAAVGRWEGRRFDDVANTLPMGGYFTLDLLTEWTFARNWKIQASAANLFGRDYQTAAFYAQDGRHYSLTIRYQSGGR